MLLSRPRGLVSASFVLYTPHIIAYELRWFIGSGVAEACVALRFEQKLVVPRHPGRLVERSHVHESLHRAVADNQVVIVAAQAGWGKTTALAQWATDAAVPVAWYALDATDRDPLVFLDYVTYSISTAVPELSSLHAHCAQLAVSNTPDAFRAASLGVANAPTPFVLLLDDFHIFDDNTLPGGELIVEFLATIAEYAPYCTLILASRTVPVLPGLARLVARDRAAVFDYTLLQWQAAEVQQLAGMRYGTMIADALATQLVTQVDGWITGIVLSLKDAVRSAGLSAHAVSADGHSLFAFFDEQILAPLPRELQVFLEDTSVLHDLSPQHCDRLRNRQDSRRLLDEVRRRGLFITSRGGWLAYHSLLRDFLRDRLAHDPEREHTLLCRAGDLYRDEDDVARALGCYLDADAADAAITMLHAAAPRLRQRSRQTTLISGLEQLAQRQSLPAELLLQQAQAYADLAFWEQATLAIHALEATGDEQTRWAAQMLLIKILTFQTQYDRALDVLHHLHYENLSPALQLDYRFAAGRLAVLCGDVTGGLAHFMEAQQMLALPPLSQNDAHTEQLGFVHDYLGWAHGSNGNLTTALHHLKQADACWQMCGDVGRRTLTLNNVGQAAMQLDQLDEARVAITTGLTLARQAVRRREEYGLCYSLADLDLREGQLESALLHFTEAYTLATQINVAHHRADAAISAAWIAVLRDEQATAHHWRDVAETLHAAQWEDLRGRWLLVHLVLHWRVEQAPRVGEQLADLMALEPTMERVERATSVLLRASYQYAESHWAAAAPFWDQFEQHAAGLPLPLLAALSQLHRALVAAAAPHSPLARQLLALLPEEPTDDWTITALGAFGCLMNGTPRDVAPLYRALLVRLLEAGPSGLSVEQLMQDVWDEAEPSLAAIRQALRRLRMQTGLDVTMRDGTCTIQSDWQHIRYDVRALEGALRPPISPDALDAAMLLYHDDFFLSAWSGAVRWASRRRESLRTRYITALEQCARAVEACEPQRATQYYQRILQLDGCREDTAANLIRLAGRFGNLTLVNTTFRKLERDLEQVGIHPEAATVALYRQYQSAA